MTLTHRSDLTETKASHDDRIHINNGAKSLDPYSHLPKAKGILGPSSLTLHQGFWCPTVMLPNVVAFQTEFRARPEDIIVASCPKSGTTWLKALIFSIVNRSHFGPNDTPLREKNPHQLVPFVENALFMAEEMAVAPSPRLLSTHIPYELLPETVKVSGCRIVYICRNPIDVLVSFWHFGVGDHPGRRARWTIDEYAESFCRGESGFGPFWNQVLGFWRASLEKPEQILFVRFEELKSEASLRVKRIAQFLGFPFTAKEEDEGVVEQILELCSLKSLKELEVNKNGKFMPNFENKSFFRKGEVGDWVNHLRPSMAERINDKVEEKLSGSGLSFKIKI